VKKQSFMIFFFFFTMFEKQKTIKRNGKKSFRN